MRENGPVIYQKIDTPKGSIVKILLNRPGHGNRIDGEMWHDFMEAVDMASADRDARVVIFGGVGDDFCCGFDTGDPSVSLNANEDGVVSFADRRENTWEEVDTWLKIYNMRKPTICMTQGTVLGGGWLIAMSCDCICSADNAVFDNTEYAMNMSYTLYLPWDAWKLPMNIAKEKAFTGYTITAPEGYRFGLCNRCVPVDKLEETTMDLAERMLKLSPYTLTMHKEMYKMAYDMRGIQQIIPFSKEIFNVSMQLPGTPENEALWEIAKTQGGAAMDAEFTRQARALREEERKFRDPSEINF